MDAPPPEPDSRNSLRHILATDPSMDDPKPEPPSQANTPVPDDGDAAAQSLWCDARTSALSFYERLGMRTEGSSFMRKGVEYVKMRRALV